MDAHRNPQYAADMTAITAMQPSKVDAIRRPVEFSLRMLFLLEASDPKSGAADGSFRSSPNLGISMLASQDLQWVLSPACDGETRTVSWQLGQGSKCIVIYGKLLGLTDWTRAAG